MRSSGILIHPTSFPSRFGVGDFGENAHTFISHVAGSGSSWWQILPITPPDSFGSPYASSSAFAINPTLIDPTPFQATVDDDVWEEFQEGTALYDDDYFDVTSVTAAKTNLLRAAFEYFQDDERFDAFVSEAGDWLREFSLFEALKARYDGGWWSWPEELVTREPTAIRASEEELADEIRFSKFQQWIANDQWSALRQHAKRLGVSILGDIPIFVSMDSADVWSNQHLFDIEEGHAKNVAGVPPDYFSPTGQKWGNPLYDWDALRQEDYQWWGARIERACELTDESRIDHFRGFESFWAVPADAPTAETGEWRRGPGHDFFDFVKRTFGDVPFVAEDLGLITHDVIALRDTYDLPGMKVMQFAFDDEQRDHPFRPHTYPARCVAYLGTHDNDTTTGWYLGTEDHVRHRVRDYFSTNDEDAPHAMMRQLFASSADRVFATPQDLLGLGTEARMNAPGRAEGNWSWRMTAQQLEDAAMWRALSALNTEYDR